MTSLALARPRIARRRAADRARILSMAAELLAAEDVTLDAIAAAADVARGTLYAHFPSKATLVAAICQPALEIVAARVAAIDEASPRKAVGALVDAYVDLWRREKNAMRVAYRAAGRGGPHGGIATVHRRYLDHVLRIFRAAQAAHILRAEDAVLAARMFRQVAVPLLELLPPDDAPSLVRFRGGMLGLLLRDAPPRARRSE